MPASRRAVLALTIAVCAVAGCTRADPGPPPQQEAVRFPKPPVDATTDYRNPAEVCLRFAAAVYRRDTTTDSGPGDAYRRAAAYMTGELAAAVAAQAHAERDASWNRWRAHRGFTDPTVVPLVDEEQPADTVREAYRAASVTVAPVGRDGWRGPVERHAVYCILHGDDQKRWRVADYDVSDLAQADIRVRPR